MNSSSDTSYDKIKHLVEIEDDIFAVFTIDFRGDANGLTVAKNVDFENSLIEHIFTNFNKMLKQDDKIIDILANSSNDIIGKLKWKVTEYEKIRILQIVNKNKIVVVLIKSNTSLHATIDNILGYYYEEDEEDDNIPKSLF
jgi:hypothetical protein